jgi:hypothetical protein
MAKEVIDLYVTCEIAKDGAGTDLVTRDDAGKNYAVVLQGNATSLHPLVRVSDQNGNTVYGKLISITTNGKLCRVAVRGANIIFANNTTFAADSHIDTGITTSSTRGVVKPGNNPNNRGTQETGRVIGGTDTELRVDMR